MYKFSKKYKIYKGGVSLETVEMLIINAEILSMDKDESTYNWMIVKDGKVLDLGVNDSYKGKYENITEVLDLGGKTLVPGFYDTHVHLVQTGLNYEGVDLRYADSISSILDLISKASKEIPKGDLIRGYHLDVTNIKEKRFPTRKELDKVAPAHPVWINSFEFHTSSVNTLALSMTNLPYSLDGIARDERNLPLGYFTGKASAFIRNKMLNYLTDDMRMKGVKKAINQALKKGVTSINTMEGGYTFHEKDANFIMKNRDLFPIDIKLFYQTFDLNKIKEYDLNCIGGDIFLDGAFSSRTAAVSTGYKDTKETNQGSLYFKQSELNYFVKEAHKNRLQISLHAIGDIAIEQALKSYEHAQSSFYIEDTRHRIEHFELATDDQIQRAADLGLVIVVQPVFEKKWGNPGGMYETRLGKDIALKTNNFRKLVDLGIVLSGSSDSDITEINPLEGIHSAVNHPKPTYSLTPMEALKMYTINSAYANFEENLKGSLEKNKYADFVVLCDNPIKIEKDKIENIKVCATVKQGNIIYMDKNFKLRGEGVEE